MLLTAHYGELKKRPEILEQMYSLRARQFSQRRGWRVVVKDGLEIDIFDDLNPLYICVLDPAGRLIASLRLLPTIGPHMLSDVFPEVMGDAVVVRHPLIWESSRFCVDTEAARQFGSDGINIVTRKILAGLFQTALDAGMQNVISVYDVFVERILKRSGCEFERLGPVVKYDDLKTVGGLFQVSRDVIDAICDEQTLVQAQIVS
tara:strand:- start:568 stop:1179 length:612 start_codon:yes stop_codon:yes gene_type:complete